MSEVMLNVLDGERAIHSRTQACVSDCVVAALSTDPESIEELQAGIWPGS